MAQIGDNPTFTTTDAVRGALGVDAKDLPDQTILDAALDIELRLDLALWVTNWSSKLNPGGTPSEEQQTLQMAIQTYCKWWCAAEYCRKYLAHIQLYGDGKAEMRRFTNFDWATLEANAQAKADYYKSMVKELDPDAPAEPASDSYALISAGIPTHDPVTNEGARE